MAQSKYSESVVLGYRPSWPGLLWKTSPRPALQSGGLPGRGMARRLSGFAQNPAGPPLPPLGSPCTCPPSGPSFPGHRAPGRGAGQSPKTPFPSPIFAGSKCYGPASARLWELSCLLVQEPREAQPSAPPYQHHLGCRAPIWGCRGFFLFPHLCLHPWGCAHASAAG